MLHYSNKSHLIKACMILTFEFITMCIAVPGIVRNIKGREASVKYPGGEGSTQKAMIGVENLKVGDSVLVQMGIIIKIIDKGEASAMQDVWANKK